MSGFIKFRSSMGGFNRVDVTNYIEKLSVEHTAALKKLEKENNELSQKLDRAEADLCSQNAKTAELEQKLAHTEAELEEALNLVTGQPAEPAPDYPSMELEAYRRAEATERLATERAAALQQQLQELTEQVSGRYGEIGLEVQTLSQDLDGNLQQLKETLAALDAVFHETTEQFDALEETVQTEE